MEVRNCHPDLSEQEHIEMGFKRPDVYKRQRAALQEIEGDNSIEKNKFSTES